MKTFEERFTAWVDGRLTGAELAAFERELQSHPEALAEKDSALALGNLFRANLTAPPLPNPDFFNLRILQQIQPAPAPRRFFWTLPRMAFSGLSLLLLATLLYFAAVPNTRREVRENQQYVSNTLNPSSGDLNAQSDDPLDGLNYMPPDYKLK
jgi:anti-sigma factor RsiW